MTFADLYRMFAEHHRQQQSAENTLIFYRTQYRAFGGQLDRHDITAINPAVLLPLLAAANAGKSSTTQRHRAVFIDQLQKYAVNNELMDKLWLRKIPKPTPQRRDRVPTDAETKALLKSAGKEFRLIYQCLRQTGARPNELCRATIADYTKTGTKGDAGVITLREHKTAKKTGKPRVIVLGTKANTLVKLAIGRRTEGPIFRGPRGKTWTVKNLSKTFTGLRRAAGLEDGLVLYSARHEAGTRFCKDHGIGAAATLLGHTNLATTQRYVHLDVEFLQAAQDGEKPKSVKSVK